MSSSAEDNADAPVRAEEEEYTLRSDTPFYPGEPRTREFRDVDGDGKLDAIILSRERNGSAIHYHLFIFSLDDGTLLFNHTFNLTSSVSLEFVEVDGDPLPELMFREQEHYVLEARLFILDTEPYRVLFDSGYMKGYISGIVIGDELIVQRTYKTHSYIADQDTWFAAYSMSNWTMVWRTMRFPRASGAYLDLDGDGIKEYLFYATWTSPAPGKSHIYFIDLDAHQVTLNSTDMEFMNYYGGGRSAMDYRDIDGDGKWEVLAVARWSANSTCKAFLYSASVNDSLWVTRDLGDYSLGDDVDWRDINGDGVEDIMMELNDPVDETISKLVVLDPLTGDVLLEEHMNDSFTTNMVWTEDFNEDGNIDLLIYNYTKWMDGKMRFKLAEPSNGWSLSYDVEVPDMRRHEIEDMDNDGDIDIMMIGRGSVPGDNIIDMRRYDPSDMSQIYSLGNFDLGPNGEFSWSKVYMGKHRELRTLTYNYRHPAGGNFSQLHILNATTGTLEYSSGRVYGELMTYMRHENYFFNGDSVKDIIISKEWKDTGDMYNWFNLTVVDCDTFEELWQSPTFERPSHWQSSNGSFPRWGKKREVFVSYSVDTGKLYSHFLFDVSGDTPEVIYEITDNVQHDLSEMDPYLDGNFLLEDESAREGIVNISFFDVDVGVPQVFVTSFELEGDYGYGGAVDAAKDGDVLWIYRTGSNPSRVYYIEPSDLSIVRMLLLDGSYEHYTVDIDKNGIKEEFWLDDHDLGSNGYSNNTVIDMETGDIITELLEVDYSIRADIIDIEDDSRNELLLTKEHYWEEPFEFGFSVYNVSTDLPPEETAPIEEVQMVEDGPAVTIDLDDHFTDEDDPLTFSLEDPDSVVEWSISGTTNELELVPARDANGLHTLILHVMDAFWDIEYSFMVNITPVNDAPVLLDVSGIADIVNISIPVVQEQENLIEVNVVDVDGDELEYLLYPEQEGVSINTTSGVISFTPQIEDGPHTDIQVNVTDGVETLTFNFTTMNENVPHAPYDVEIVAPTNGTASSGELHFRASARDHDIPWGDELTFEWTSNIDGELGSGKELMMTGLTSGEHVITLNVSDNSGLYMKDMIVITVLPFVQFENLTGIEPTTNMSLVMDTCVVDAHFEIVNSTTYATYDVFMKGTGRPDLSKVLLYIFVPLDDEYIPFDPMMEGQAEAVINGTMWEYSRIYSLQLPGSNHSEEDLRSIVFEMAVVGWNSDGLFDVVYKGAEMSYSFVNGTVDDDDVTDDDTTDDDDTADDDDDTESKGSGIAMALVLIFIILILLGIVIVILVSRSRGSDEGWDEE